MPVRVRKGKSFSSGMREMSSPKSKMLPFGAKQPDDELEQDALAYSGGPEQNAGLAGRYGEADVLRTGGPSKRWIRSFSATTGDRHSGAPGKPAELGAMAALLMSGRRESSTWVMRKSTR
jgi:hypothetical protein